MDLPTVSRDYAITANGCGTNEEIFRTEISIEEMQQRYYGFRGCIEHIDSARLTVDELDYGPGRGCASPRGTVSGIALHLDYEAQGVTRTKTISCGEQVDLSRQRDVHDAVNRCLSRVAAKKDVIMDVLNQGAGQMTARITGDCSTDACFMAAASLNVSLDGIVATNCQ